MEGLACPRCRGRLYLEARHEEPELACLACGWMPTTTLAERGLPDPLAVGVDQSGTPMQRRSKGPSHGRTKLG